eukprot:8625512-Ditylum_brightwellii.AAC.1
MPTLTPKTTQKDSLPSTTTNKNNNQLSGAFTGTSRTQLPHRCPHYGNDAPSSDAGATFLAPKSGNGTNNANVPQCMQKYSRQHCPNAT